MCISKYRIKKQPGYIGGPMVMETPAGMLGAFNDAWFRYIADIGPFGEDKGKGGKYLILPPDYNGEIPEGYFTEVSLLIKC